MPDIPELIYCLFLHLGVSDELTISLSLFFCSAYFCYSISLLKYIKYKLNSLFKRHNSKHSISLSITKIPSLKFYFSLNIENEKCVSIDFQSCVCCNTYHTHALENYYMYNNIFSLTCVLSFSLVLKKVAVVHSLDWSSMSNLVVAFPSQ